MYSKHNPKGRSDIETEKEKDDDILYRWRVVYLLFACIILTEPKNHRGNETDRDAVSKRE